MAVTLNSALSGHVTADNPAINVVFPSSQEITINGPDDTITPVDDNGTYIALATEAKQDTLIAAVDGVEILLTTIEANQLPDNHQVTVSSSALPTGAATAAKQDTIIGHVDGIETLLTTIEANQLPDNHNVVVSSSALPTGAATAANQATANASLSSIDTKLTSPLTVTGPLTDTQLRATPVPISGTVTANAGTGTFAVSAASLPLPTGAATEAKQDTIISHVDGVETLLTTIEANQLPDNHNVTVSASALPTGAATAALQTTGNTSLSSIDGKLNSLGQKTSVNSVPVVVASDQSNIPVNLHDGAGNSLESSTSGAPSLSSRGLVVRPLPYEPATYSAATVGLTVAAGPTDIWTITGSNTKTIRLHRVKITATTTSGFAINVNFSLVKHSTANTGGTSATVTAVAHDSTDAAATAVVRQYTANPTIGTVVGTIRNNRLGVTNQGLSGGEVEWVFEADHKVPYLRGTSEQYAVNLNGTSITGSNVSIDVEWSEI